MIVYYVIYITLFLLGIYFYDKRDIYALAGTGIILFIIVASRGKEVGGDYQNYEYYYQIINSNNKGELIAFVEPTFVILSKLLPDIRSVIIAYAFLGIYFTVIAINKLTPFGFLSLAIWSSNFFLIQEMNQIRVAVAISILLISIQFIPKRKSTYFFLLIIAATSFHYSAILFAPLYFTNYRKLHPAYYFLIPLAYLLNIFGIGFLEILKGIRIDVLQGKLEIYNNLYAQGQYTKINIYNPLILSRIVMIYLLMGNWERISLENKYFIILIKCYVLSIVLLIMFSKLPVFGYRISEVFGIVEFIVIPFLLFVYRPRQLILIIIFFFGLFFLSIDLFYNKFLTAYSF